MSKIHLLGLSLFMVPLWIEEVLGKKFINLTYTWFQTSAATCVRSALFWDFTRRGLFRNVCKKLLIYAV